MSEDQPVWTLLSALALALHPEGADVRPVAFVVGGGPSQLRQQLRALRGQLAEGADGSDLTGLLLLRDLAIDVLEVVLTVDVGLRKARVQLQRSIANLITKILSC